MAGSLAEMLKRDGCRSIYGNPTSRANVERRVEIKIALRIESRAAMWLMIGM